MPTTYLISLTGPGGARSFSTSAVAILWLTLMTRSVGISMISFAILTSDFDIMLRAKSRDTGQDRKKG